MIRQAVTLLNLFISCQLLAQPQMTNPVQPELEGKLIEASTGEPLGYATVMVYSAQDSSMVGNALTEADGSFTVNVDPGKHYVKIQYVGFQEKIIPNIRVKEEDKVDLGTIKIEQAAVALGEVEVAAERSQMQLKLDRRVFNVGKDLSSAGANAVDILDNLPSITVDTEGNVSLRGSNSIRILINGKPSSLAGAGDLAALRRMQGDMIERIEVITNPSARYEAEGEAGIINIILKKEEDKGLNGSFGLTAGTPENYGASYSLNFRRDKLNFFSNFGLNYRRSPGGGFTTQRFFNADEELTQRTTIDRDQDRGGYGGNLQVGMDWFLSPGQTITGSILYRQGKDDNFSEIRYSDFDGNDNLLGTVLRDNEEDEEEYNAEVNLNYTREFERDDHKWTVDFRYNLDDDTEIAEYVETGYNLDEALQQRSSNTEDELNYLFQTDYVQPFGENSRFEAGLRAALRTVNNDFTVEEENENGSYQILPNFNDELEYKEDVYAAYVIGATELTERIGVQVGLRAEYSDIQAALLETNTVNDQEYLNFFPSASISYKFSEEKQLQTTFSRRLSRPYFRRLLPFSSLRDRRNIRQGNPNLRPEYTNSYEVTYLQYLEKGSLLSSVYYRRTTGVIDRITIPGEDGTSLQIPVNLSERDAYGLEFNFSYDFFNWWTVSSDVNFFRQQINGEFEGQNFDNETFAWNGRIDSKLEVGPLEIQPAFNYRGPRNTAQGRRKSSYALNIGVATKVFGGRGNITVSGRDLFNTRQRRSLIDIAGFEEESTFQWRQTRRLVVQLNYQLRKKNNPGRSIKGRN